MLTVLPQIDIGEQMPVLFSSGIKLFAISINNPG
jgi:hypothetical protein